MLVSPEYSQDYGVVSRLENCETSGRLEYNYKVAVVRGGGR